MNRPKVRSFWFHFWAAFQGERDQALQDGGLAILACAIGFLAEPFDKASMWGVIAVLVWVLSRSVWRAGRAFGLEIKGQHLWDSPAACRERERCAAEVARDRATALGRERRQRAESAQEAVETAAKYVPLLDRLIEKAIDTPNRLRGLMSENNLIIEVESRIEADRHDVEDMLRRLSVHRTMYQNCATERHDFPLDCVGVNSFMRGGMALTAKEIDRLKRKKLEAYYMHISWMYAVSGALKQIKQDLIKRAEDAEAYLQRFSI